MLFILQKLKEDHSMFIDQIILKDLLRNSEHDYEELYITEDDCKVKFIKINNDGSYEIKNNEYDLRNCKFIDDNTQQIEYQRWSYGKILDCFFTVPLYNHYIIHK